MEDQVSRSTVCTTGMARIQKECATMLVPMMMMITMNHYDVDINDDDDDDFDNDDDIDDDLT